MTNMHILNTRGAAKRLGCSVTWIHKLVSEGKLRAYVYDDTGRLVERKPEETKRGKGLYFRVSDVDTYQSSLQHRHFGGEN